MTDLLTAVAKAGFSLAKTAYSLAPYLVKEGYYGDKPGDSVPDLPKLRTEFSYKVLMQHEHVSNFDKILAIIKHFFGIIVITYFPVYGKHLSLYDVY